MCFSMKIVQMPLSVAPYFGLSGCREKIHDVLKTFSLMKTYQLMT